MNMLWYSGTQHQLTRRWTLGLCSVTTRVTYPVGLPKGLLSCFMLCLEFSRLARVSSLISQPVTSQKWLSHFAKQLFQGLLGWWREEVQHGAEDSKARLSGTDTGKQEKGPTDGQRPTETRGGENIQTWESLPARFVLSAARASTEDERRRDGTTSLNSPLGNVGSLDYKHNSRTNWPLNNWKQIEMFYYLRPVLGKGRFLPLGGN